MGGVLQDLRYALRRVRMSPGFSLVVVLTIGLGIAGATYVFSELNTLYLRPLQLREPDRLFTVARLDERGMPSPFFVPSGYEALRRSGARVSGWTAAAQGAFGVGGDGLGRAEAAAGKFVDADYFAVLGASPALGRFPSAADHAPGAEPVVVLGHDLWRRRFDADPTVVGSVIRLSGREVTVVGVAPRDFNGVNRAVAEDVWLPLSAYPVFNPSPVAGAPNPPSLEVFGRLAPGATREQVRAALATSAAEVAATDPAARDTRRLAVYPLRGLPAAGHAEGINRKTLQLGVALLVLLIASVNVAGMLLVRATARRKEIALRVAVGAPAGRIVRQLLVESMTLFLLGGLLGVWLVLLAGRSRPGALSSSMPLRLVLDYGLDGRVLAFALGTALLTSVVFGLVPALHASRADLVSALKDTPEPGKRPSRLRDALIVGQLAASVLLLVPAGVFVQSLLRAGSVDPGFAPAGVAVASVDARLLGYDESRARALYEQIADRLRTAPGVEAAGVASAVPFSNATSAMAVQAEGGEGGGVGVEVARVSPDYLGALRVPLVSGRPFSTADRADSPPVALLSRQAAETLFPGQDPVGKRLAVGPRRIEVVGVVGDVQSRRLGERAALQVYFPLAQDFSTGVSFVVRARGGDAAAVSLLRREVAALAPDLPLTRLIPLGELVGESLSGERTAAVRTGFFALVALLLASLGLYGGMSYLVERRTREIGVRMALGAHAADVLRMVMWRGLGLAAAGLGAGLMGALAFTRLLTSRVYGVGSAGPLMLVAVVAVLLAVSFVACLLPARRAAGLDPMRALRTE